MQDSRSDHRSYWDLFYAGRASTSVPDAPSSFAEWVAPQLAQDQLVAEFGFGNARDSLWFSRRGHPVLGFDFAETAVRQAQGRADGERLHATFSELDLYDQAAVKLVAGSIRDRAENPAIYGRFLIHSLEDAGRHNLFDLAAEALTSGGQLFVEFRTGQDRGETHVFGDDHFRLYLDPSDVAAELQARGGSVVHCEAGHGLAPYKSEDPHVARIVATWSS